MNRSRLYRLGVVIAFPLLLFMSSCDETGSMDDVSFDRSAMLSSLTDGLIIPNFEKLQASVNELAVASSNFNQEPTISGLNLLRSAWVAAVIDYQHCSAFGFGPGSLPLGPFSSVLGVFPVDETQVEANILNSDFNLPASFDRDVRGFYAVEYLIYNEGLSDEEVMAGFDQERKDYLALIIDELKTTIDDITAEWKRTYKAEFISNDGTSAGSSISLLYNEFVKDYENLKNFKVELPAGLTAGQSGADPKLVEAYYSGISRQLLLVHFESSKNIWQGASREGLNLIGFEEYLEEVVGGPELISKTRTTLASIDEAMSRLPDGRLSENVESSQIEALRDLLQSNTANFKSSMSSLLGISITFNSGDGD